MIAWAVDALIGASLLMLLVLAVRIPVARLFGAGWAYALWLLPLLRLFLPPIDLFGSDLASALPRYTMVVIPAMGGEAAVPAAEAAGTSLLPFLLALWAGGAAVFAMWQQSAYSAFLLSLGTARRADPPYHGGIPVVESEVVDGPLAVGILNRRIVVPPDFHARYGPAERRLALDHELVHHRRGDIVWNMAALAVLALNWFNPIAHIAFRAFRTDQELACDAAVAAHIPPSGLHDYALALIKSASRPGQIAACPLNHADQLKRRLKMMKEHRVSRARSAGGFVAVAGLVTSGLALSSPGFAQQQEVAPSPLLLEASSGPDSLISRGELARLVVKCRTKGRETPPRYRSSGRDDYPVILCDNGKPLDDPEVHAIVDKALVRADARRASIERTRDQAAEAREQALEAKIEALEARTEAQAEARAARGEAIARRQEALMVRLRVRTEVQAALGVRNRQAHVHRLAAQQIAWTERDQAQEEARVEREIALAEARAEREAEQAERLAEQAEARAEREAEQAEARAEREAEQAQARAEREAEQAQARAERHAAQAEARAHAQAERAHKQAERAHAAAERAHRQAERAHAEAERAHARVERDFARAQARAERAAAHLAPAQARAVRLAHAQARAGLAAARAQLRISRTPALKKRDLFAVRAPRPAAPARNAVEVRIERELEDVGTTIEQSLDDLEETLRFD